MKNIKSYTTTYKSKKKTEHLLMRQKNENCKLIQSEKSNIFWIKLLTTQIQKKTIMNHNFIIM